MSTTSVYFIPDDSFPQDQFKAKTEAILEQLGLVDGYYDEDEEQYAPGDQIEFEYAAIRDGDIKRLVPEASSEGYGATCPHCNSDMDDHFYDVLNDFYDLESETGKEKDMATLSFTCPSCNSSIKAEDINFKLPVSWASQFFRFVEITEEVTPELLQAIQTKFDTTFKLVYERM